LDSQVLDPQVLAPQVLAPKVLAPKPLELMERAWINIAFARAEILRSHLDSEAFLRIVGHLDEALDDLQIGAPPHDAPRPSDRTEHVG
jgi:hypothetical protein